MDRSTFFENIDRLLAQRAEDEERARREAHSKALVWEVAARQFATAAGSLLQDYETELSSRGFAVERECGDLSFAFRLRAPDGGSVGFEFRSRTSSIGYEYVSSIIGPDGTGISTFLGVEPMIETICNLDTLEHRIQQTVEVYLARTWRG